MMMNKSKQTTLFQSWGTVTSSFPLQQQSRPPGPSKPDKPRPRKNGKVGGPGNRQASTNSKVTAARPSAVIDLCGDSDNDEDLIAALEESLKYVDHRANSACSSRNVDSFEDHGMMSGALAEHSRCQTVSSSTIVDRDSTAGNISRNVDSRQQTINDVLMSSSATTHNGCQTLAVASNTNSTISKKPNRSTEEYLFSCSEMPRVSATEVEDYPGFDSEAGRIWIYPTNYPVREYQLQIVRQALVRNTMVTLPTGLGKTFIAAVVMFNYYRWYPTSKIVFMAPTKPLVAQQIEACHSVMGIPVDDTAEMTG